MFISSNGVLQPFRLLGWWRWMYRLSPYTYLIEGLLGQGMFPGIMGLTCVANYSFVSYWKATNYLL